MDGKWIDQDPMQMSVWSLGMAMAWIAHRCIDGASDLWQSSLEGALFGEDDALRTNRPFMEAQTALKNALEGDVVSASGLSPDGTRVTIPAREWIDLQFTYGWEDKHPHRMNEEPGLVHRASRAGAIAYTELRVSRADILKRWPAEQAAAPDTRRRGPVTAKREAVKSAMAEYNSAHGDLGTMKEEAMAARFGASRDTCRKAREELLGMVSR